MASAITAPQENWRIVLSNTSLPGGFVSLGQRSALDRPASYQGGREGTAGEDVKAILAQSDMTAAQGNSSASFASILGQDIENYRKIVQAGKIKV